MIRMDHYLETIHTKKGALNERTLYAMRIRGYSKPVAYIHSSYNRVNQAYSLIVTDNHEIKLWEGIHRWYKLFGTIKPTIDQIFTIYLSDHGLLMDIQYKVSKIKILDLDDLIKTGHPLSPSISLSNRLSLDRELNSLANLLKLENKLIKSSKVIIPKINLTDGELVISFRYNDSIIKLGTISGLNVSCSMLEIDNEHIRSLKDEAIEIKHPLGKLVVNKSISILIEVVNNDLILVTMNNTADTPTSSYTFAINIKEKEVK